MQPENHNEMFIMLMRIAQEDVEVRNQLEMILEMESHQRQSALATFRDRVMLQHGSAELASAISCLESDEIASRARELLAPSLKKGRLSSFLTCLKWFFSILFGGAAFVAIACVLMLCVDTWIIPVIGPVQFALLTVSFLVGAVFGIMSFVQESWYWLGICAVIYGLVGLIIRNMFM